MKKSLYILFALLLVWQLIGCLPTADGTDPAPATSAGIGEFQLVQIQGELYYNTFLPGELTGRCGVMDGEVTTAVKSGTVPANDDQSNFGTGYGYQWTGTPGTVELLMDGEFVVFKCLYPTNDYGVKLKAGDVTPGGMTLTCTRADGSPAEVITGSPYDLYVFRKGTWQPVEAAGERIFTSIAYFVQQEVPLEWTLDWSRDYGMLPPGDYRLVKHFSGQAGEAFECYVDFNLK